MTRQTQREGRNAGVYSITLTDDIVAHLDKFADERGTSRSGAITILVSERTGAALPVFERTRKLSTEDIAAIRARLAEGTKWGDLERIAKEYNVDRSWISRIKTAMEAEAKPPRARKKRVA